MIERVDRGRLHDNSHNPPSDTAAVDGAVSTDLALSIPELPCNHAY